MLFGISTKLSLSLTCFPVYAVVAGDIQTVVAPFLDRVLVAVRVYFNRITCTEWHVLLGKEALEETLCSFLSMHRWV